MKLFPLWLALLLFGCAALAQDLSVPEVHRRATDNTGTLSAGELNALESELASFERETSNQIVVLMVSSLEGESLEDYTIRVAEKNKLGKKGRDNGVLLLVAKDDRKIRIEVGYGLEGVLTDALSGQIIRQNILPHFRDGDYYGGLQSGIQAIMAATKGEYQGEPESGRQRRSLIPYLVAIFFILVPVLSRITGGSRRHTVGPGGTFSSGGWWWGGFGGGGGGGGGGWGGGGFGGGGGGFSGGGGSFGGGGASGSW